MGYTPSQEKVAVIELDKNDTPLKTASVFQVNADGTTVEKYKGDIKVWGPYLRYNYVRFDFSRVKEPGVYYIRYGDQKTNTFVIDGNVYGNVWHPTLDVWFPVQMDHMSDSPMGPYQPVGVIMDESPSGCWTNHHSIVNYKNQWYLFYHDRDYSPKFDKNRSVRIDSLTFNADGTIKKVIPTFRGVGLSDATKEIQLDRYSKISEKGASIALLDTADTFKGWKTIFDASGS